MFRPFITTLATAGLLVGAAAAAEPTVGAALGTDPARIAATLSAESYNITRYERLPDAISITATNEDRRLELAVDRTTGAVIGLAEYRRDARERPGVGFDAVQAMLAEQGYTVIGYQREDGEIEVDATRNGGRWELTVDPQSGNVREAEEES